MGPHRNDNIQKSKQPHEKNIHPILSGREILCAKHKKKKPTNRETETQAHQKEEEKCRHRNTKNHRENTKKVIQIKTGQGGRNPNNVASKTTFQVATTQAGNLARRFYMGDWRMGRISGHSRRIPGPAGGKSKMAQKGKIGDGRDTRKQPTNQKKTTTTTVVGNQDVSRSGILSHWDIGIVGKRERGKVAGGNQ